MPPAPSMERASRRGKAPTAKSPEPQIATPSLLARVLDGVDVGRSAPIGSAEKATRIGTRRDNELTLTDPDVAERHAELWITDDGVGVRALDPARPVFVGAVRVREAVVPPGARLRVGASQLCVEGAPVEGLRALLAREGLAFEGASMLAVGEAIVRLAPHTTSVLIEGETGTGKEVVARAIHRLGLRANGPFVTVDCGALPQSLLESELFGHERGAFTGADRRYGGAFERAHGGTLFLDEIGELPPGQQPALLGVLQRRRFRRVGGDREIEVDVRVVAATNRDLRAHIARGAFRDDLYYRLAGAHLVVPALRDRPEDLPALIAHLAAELTGCADGVTLGPRELAALRAHSFPGNVRELRAVIERVHTLGRFDLGEGEARPPKPLITGSDRPALAEALPAYRDARARTLQQFERDFLGRLIQSCDGNASEAARVARMDRPFLLKLLHRHGLR